MAEGSKKVGLVFTVGYNGYDAIWEDCVNATKAYCDRLQYSFCIVGQDTYTDLSMESAWVKIPLIIAAIDAGHQELMFIDSDARPSADCPNFSDLFSEGKDVYIANGFSGRPNSGVMIIRPSRKSRAFFKEVLEIAGKKIPRKHVVGWGENGEVINVASRSETFQSISHKWNNNRDPELDDYVRHYSAGPMRRVYKFKEDGRNTLNKNKSTPTIAKPGSAKFFQGLIDLLQGETIRSEYFSLDNVRLELESLRDAASE